MTTENRLGTSLGSWSPRLCHLMPKSSDDTCSDCCVSRGSNSVRTIISQHQAIASERFGRYIPISAGTDWKKRESSSRSGSLESQSILRQVRKSIPSALILTLCSWMGMTSLLPSFGWRLCGGVFQFRRDMVVDFGILVFDRSNGKLFGLLALADPVFNLRKRDMWIGWDVRTREQMLSHVMDAYVLGSIPPYNRLLGAKFVSLLAASDYTRSVFQRRYSKKRSVILGRAI